MRAMEVCKVCGYESAYVTPDYCPECMRRRAEPLKPERESINEAVRSYEHALIEWETCARDIRELSSRRRDLERDIEFRRAELRLDPRIDGKNEAARDAQMLEIAKDDVLYLGNLSALDTTKTEIQRLQDESSAARDRMSLAKRIIDWAIVYAKVLGGER